ncbi:Retrovirus-related Pol polyprotein from transposon 412, partial [Smittium mucronatum]
AMKIIEDEEKVYELLKKCSNVDRNRILDKDLVTFSEIMEFFLTEEERAQKFGKASKGRSETKDKTSTKLESYRFEESNQNRRLSIPSQKEASGYKCFNCSEIGHYARDCTRLINQNRFKGENMLTPEDRNKQTRRIPFSSENYGRDHKKPDMRSTPTPIRKLYKNDNNINLVELNSVKTMEPSVIAVTGEVKLNGKIAKFQYDSGAAINVISEDLANELDIGPSHNSDVRISQADGEGQPTKLIPGVMMEFGEFKCSSDLHIIKTSRSKLLLLGIDFFFQIGAEISLRNKQMTVEKDGRLFTIPLTLETKSKPYIRKVFTISNLQSAPKLPEFGELINKNLKKNESDKMKKILEKFSPSFASELEDLRGADVETCEIKLLETNPIRLRPYKLAKMLQEENPSDFLSRFPWSDIPQDIEEEVLYISVSNYNEIKETLTSFEKASQIGDANEEQLNIAEQYRCTNGTLYFKRGDNWMKFLPPSEIRDSIQKLHSEKHQNSHNTHQMLIKHFHAPESSKIVDDVVRKCEFCQRGNYSVRRSVPFNGVQAAGPFKQWGLDVAGPLPKTKIYGNKYIIVAIDYFTKWPVAVAVPEINASVIITFMCEQIISNFGVPLTLITDRGTHLSNEACATFNRYLGINHKPVTAYRPHANGQVERTIQTFKQIMKKICSDDKQNWDNYIWRTLLAMRTSINRSIGKTPAEILYGLALITPAIWESQPLTKDIGSETLLEERKNFIVEVLPTYRQAAYELGVKSKKIEALYYNKKVRPRKFKMGDQVLKALAVPYTALSDKNVGPFQVSKDCGDGVYEITDTDGASDFVHSDRLVKYNSAWNAVPVVQTGMVIFTMPIGLQVSKSNFKICDVWDIIRSVFFTKSLAKQTGRPTFCAHGLVSIGYIPTREPDACVPFNRSLAADCKSEAAMIDGWSNKCVLECSADSKAGDVLFSYFKSAYVCDVWDIHVYLRLLESEYIPKVESSLVKSTVYISDELYTTGGSIHGLRPKVYTKDFCYIKDAPDVRDISIDLSFSNQSALVCEYVKSSVCDRGSYNKTKGETNYDVLTLASDNSVEGTKDYECKPASGPNVASRVVRYHSGLEEVLTNLKNLSISSADKTTEPESWVKQPPKIFRGKWDEDVEPFLKTFNDHVASMGVKLDGAEIISYFKEYLDGEALRISSPLSIIYPEWSLFISKFSFRFDGKEKIVQARKELNKLDLYSDEVLFIFAKISTIFQAMKIIEDEEKVYELLKKCSNVDRNRILDKDLVTFSDIMEFFLTEEERAQKFGKASKGRSETKDKTSTKLESYRFEESNQNRRLSIPSQKEASGYKCFNCSEIGHYARDCTRLINQNRFKGENMLTPEDRNKQTRRIPFSSENYGRDHKKPDMRSTPTPIRKLYKNDNNINLVELNSVKTMEPSVIAVTGEVKLNGKIAKFQYDSGAAINVISEDLANELDIGPSQNSDVRISQADGEGQPTKLIPGVMMEFGEFKCSSDLHIIKTSRSKLLLLGIDFFFQIGAEISLRNKQMTVEKDGRLFTIPLTLETKSKPYIRKVFTISNLQSAPKLPEFGELINKNLKKNESDKMKKILEKFSPSFASELEDLRGADVETCEIKLLETNPIRLRPYKLAKMLQEENPSDFLSRFPWIDIHQDIEEEVLYISVSNYNEIKETLTSFEKASQIGDANEEQLNIAEQYRCTNGTLYFKRGDNWMKFLPPSEIRDSIQKLHSEKHQNSHNTHQMLIKHFHAPESSKIVDDVVRKCEFCQRGNYSVRRSVPFNGVQAAGPFKQWGLDVAGPLPKTKIYGNKYIIVAIDYFTKWPVAVAVPEINASVIITFMCEQIISNFGVPLTLITDRGTHLSNEACATFNRYLGINHKPVTAYRPHANGQVERTIQTFKQIMKKICSDDKQNWDNYIWRTLLAMRTSINRSIGKTPAEILYGLALITPAIWESQPLTKDIGSETLLEERKNFIVEVLPTYRQAAYELGVKSKKIEALYYNKKVRPRKFKMGDQVLKALAVPYTALSDKNVGPFQVSKDCGDGVYEITDTDGASDFVHSDRLVKYNSAWNAVPVVQTGKARSTLPSLIRPFRGKVNEVVLF